MSKTRPRRTDTERVLFGDAVHFLHNVHPGCLWAKKGQRPALTANSGRRRYSVLGGYAVSGEYVGVQTDGMVNAQTVIAWIDRLEAAFPRQSASRCMWTMPATFMPVW